MAEIRHRVGIKGSLRAVYEAVTQPTQLIGWWASSATGSPVIGHQLVLYFADLAKLSFEVLDLGWSWLARAGDRDASGLGQAIVACATRRTFR